MSQHLRIWFAVAAVALGELLAHNASVASEQPTYSFDLPAQPLADALRAVARQTGANVLFEAKDLSGIQVPELKGQLTAAEAIARLLAGTQLQSHRTTPTTVIVQPSSSAASTTPSPFGDVDRRQRDAIRLAQVEVPAGSSSDVPSTANEESHRGIQEVTVTATKRSERVQDIPISIGVITSADIERRALVNSEDYLRGMPGVNQTGDFVGQAIVIRGLETSPAAQNSLSGTTTATYFGESPTTNSAGVAGSTAIDIKLVDIARVEVLRGPQGTAFGSSSLGGVVRTIPVAPRLDRFEGRVGTSYSQTGREGGDNYMLQGVLNVPLVSDKVAVRAVAYRFEDSGYYRNVAGSDAAVQAAAGALGAGFFAVNKSGIGDSRATGARLSALVQANENLKLTFSYLDQRTQLDGTPVANQPGYTQNFLQVAPSHEKRGQTAGFADTHIKLANAVAEQDLGWGSLLATYSRGRSGSERAESYSIFPGFYPSFPFGHSENGPHRESNAELRLTTRLPGALNGLVGVFTEHQQDDNFHEFLWYGSPATNFFNPGQSSIAHFTFHNDLKQTAAFGELSWNILSKLTLTGGVRAYDYKRTTHARNEGALTAGGFQIIDRSSKASGTTFRGNLSYKPISDALLYASFAQGFRLGAPKNGVSTTVCDTNDDGIVDGSNVPVEATRQTKSDTVDSYELGGKALILDRRLQIDAAVYRIDWTSLPVYRFFQCGQNALLNAGKARSEGVELQISAFVTPALRIDAGASTVDARFLTDETLSFGAPPGTQLAGSPDFNANLGMEYGFDLRGHAVSLRADGIYVGSFYGDPAKSASTRAGDYVKLDLSARTTFGNLNVDLFARNVLNADDYTFRFIYAGMGDDYGYRMRPRTVGVQVAYTF